VNKDLIINSSPEGVEIALLEEKKLVEIHNEKIDARWSVGDLYLGKVKKIIPGQEWLPRSYRLIRCRSAEVSRLQLAPLEPPAPD
jgi:hypothetical protein